MSLIDVFSTPIFVKNLGEPNISEIQKFYSTFSGYENISTDSDHGWNCNVDTSFFVAKGALSKDEMAFFLNKIESSVQEYITPYTTSIWNPDNFNVQIWLNKYTKGQYQESHNHVGNAVSFNYVIKSQNMDNKFVLIDYSKSCAESVAYQSGIDFFQGKREFNLKAGDLILFPSWVNHYVTPSHKDGERITISGNLKF